MKSLVTLEWVKYRSNSSYSGTKIPKGVNWPLRLKIVVGARRCPCGWAAPGERADLHRRLGVQRHPQRVAGRLGVLMHLLQFREDGVGFGDFFWGRHLRTLPRRKPRALSLVVMVCRLGSCSSV